MKDQLKELVKQNVKITGKNFSIFGVLKFHGVKFTVSANNIVVSFNPTEVKSVNLKHRFIRLFVK
jgi:hypothetical protein